MLLLRLKKKKNIVSAISETIKVKIHSEKSTEEQITNLMTSISRNVLAPERRHELERNTQHLQEILELGKLACNRGVAPS